MGRRGERKEEVRVKGQGGKKIFLIQLTIVFYLNSEKEYAKSCTGGRGDWPAGNSLYQKGTVGPGGHQAD